MKNEILALASPLLLVLMVLAGNPAGASELLYTPVNPTFGGNPGNGPNLLGVANAQNSTHAPTLSPLETFSKNLQNAIYSHLQTATINGLFPANNTKPNLSTGPISVGAGNFTVTAAPDPNDPNVLVITTTDTITGATASFTVSTGF